MLYMYIAFAVGGQCEKLKWRETEGMWRVYKESGVYIRNMACI